jgi:hypothetical protein
MEFKPVVIGYKKPVRGAGDVCESLLEEIVGDSA